MQNEKMIVRHLSCIALVAAFFLFRHAAAAPPEVTLAREGQALLPVVVAPGAPAEVRAAAAELAGRLERISGVPFPVEEGDGERGIAVGLPDHFAAAAVAALFNPEDPRRREEYLLRTHPAGVFIIGATGPAVGHANEDFLHRLGWRQFFPGETWEVVPRLENPVVALDEFQAPAFGIQRNIWYGFGAYGPSRGDRATWVRRNRLGGAVPISIGHTWHGLDRERDFAANPEWFALVDGRRRNSKPCYSHPEVIARAVEFALGRADAGAAMVSMSPPDGLNYCECEKCFAVFQGGEPVAKRGTWFAVRPDGLEVNVTSETLFAMVNRVAAAVAEKYPRTLIGCYAYSAYSHPPSFPLHPNVYIQTTTAYRRTDLTLEEQLVVFGERVANVGIREYYSVYQWDWDWPNPGKLAPERLARDLSLFSRNNVTAVNAEASNNWAPRGLGYYLAARLMWDLDTDITATLADFYHLAFGPAAGAMERYYVRWYGASAAALNPGLAREPEEPFRRGGAPTPEALRAAFRDLDEAVSLTEAGSAYRARVDHLRFYVHYLVLREKLEEAHRGRDWEAIRAAIGAETVFGGRLTHLNIIHSRPLIGKAFPRRFRSWWDRLQEVPEAAEWGQGWRVVGEPPDSDELERLWGESRAYLFPPASDRQ